VAVLVTMVIGIILPAQDLRIFLTGNLVMAETVTETSARVAPAPLRN
jgi:hypothetical protein